MDESTRPKLDYVSLLRRAAVKRWKLVLLLFVGVAAPVTAWTLFMVPKTYQAAATIFMDDPQTTSPSFIRDFLPPSDAAFQLALLRSRSLADAVADSLSREATEELLRRAMHRNYVLEAQNAVRRLLGRGVIVHSPRERILAEIQRSRVRFIPSKTGEMTISAVAYQPRVAMELANIYVEVLQARSRSATRDEARAAREFIEASLNQVKTALQESEDALAKLQQANGSIKLPQRSDVDLRKLAEMENSLGDIQVSKQIARVRLNFLRGQDVTGAPLPPAPRPTVEQTRQREMRERLAQLEDRLAALQDKYTDQHPLVLAMESEIRETRGRLGGSAEPLPDPRPVAPSAPAPVDRAALARQIADLEVEVSALATREESVKTRIATLTRSMSSLSAGELETSRLLRAVETQRNLHAVLSEKLSAARIQEQAERRGVRVIDPAALPSTPNSTSTSKNILLGLLLGLGLGGGVALLIEYFNQPVETEADVAQVTDLPVLGWLPRVRRGPAERNGNAAPVRFVDTPVPLSLPVEGCRSIRTSLELSNPRRPLRTIMVASPGPREGKSTVLLNLATVFRELGRRVVIVDSDLRRPVLHRALGSASQSGLADLLAADASWDQVQRSIKEDFLFLPAGSRRGTNPGALLSPDRIRRLLDTMEDHADLILFDSAPILAVSDNLTLASMVDGVILVVRAGQTQWRDLVRAKEQLEKVGAPLLGIVINQVSPRQTRRYYAPYGEYYFPDPARKRSWKPWSWWRPGSRRAGREKKGHVR